MRRVAGFLGSLVLPGAGQLAVGRWRRAIVWFLVQLAAALLIVPFGAKGLAAALLIRIGAAVEVFFLRRDPRTEPTWDLVMALWSGIGIFVGLSWYVVTTHLVDSYVIWSDVMQPAAMFGDHVLVDKWKKGQVPERGSLVAFHSPDEHTHWAYVRRVAAVGGETVDGKVVPPGALWVLGDNVRESLDSRSFGPVPADHIIGPVSDVWWSWDPQKGLRWRRLGIRPK